MGEHMGRVRVLRRDISGGAALLEVLLATALLGGVLSLYVDAGRIALLYQRQAWDGVQALLAAHSLIEAAVANPSADYAREEGAEASDCGLWDCADEELASWELARWREGLRSDLGGGQGAVEWLDGSLRVGVGWRHPIDGGERWLWLDGP